MISRILCRMVSMNNTYVSLDEDVERLIKILKQEAINHNPNLTIYSYTEKQPLINPILYYHSLTVQTLKRKGYIKNFKTGSFVDETAPGLAGPTFYEVQVKTTKFNIKSTRQQSTPLKLPPTITWIKKPDSCLLQFPDGKKFEYVSLESPSAQYFCILMENRGLCVLNTEACKKIVPPCVPNHIYSLKRTILDQISRSDLGRRMILESKSKLGYTLTISD